MLWIASLWATLTAKPWFAALVKWLAIGAAAVVALLTILARAKRQGAQEEKTKQAEAGQEIARKQAQVPQPLPGQTESRLDKETF